MYTGEVLMETLGEINNSNQLFDAASLSELNPISCKQWKFYHNLLLPDPTHLSSSNPCSLSLVSKSALHFQTHTYPHTHTQPLLQSFMFFLFYGQKALAFSLSTKWSIWAVCNFYTSCVLRMCESFRAWHRISSKATSLSACSRWLISQRASFHQPERRIIWLIYYYGSSPWKFPQKTFLHDM